MPASVVPRGKRRINRGDRLFTPLNDLLIILAAICHAASELSDGQTHRLPAPKMRVNARRLGFAFAIPLRKPLELALADRIPDSIEIGLNEPAGAGVA